MAGPTSELNLADLLERIAARHPERPALLHPGGTTTYAELAVRARKVARVLADHGLGCRTERADLRGHESGQDLVAQLMWNGPAYVEGMLGCFRARAAAFNVNYRSTATELAAVLGYARPRAIQFHGRFSPLVAQVDTAGMLLLQVADDSGEPLLPGAVDYEQAVAAAPDEVDATPSPDDLYVLFTGGTTGTPKGVLWRQADIAVGALGMTQRSGEPWESAEHLVANLRATPGRLLPAAPLMHGAAQWIALQALGQGDAVVLPPPTAGLDAGAVWDAVERHRVTLLCIVGDAFARPLLDEIEARPRDTGSLRYLANGGAGLHPQHRERLVRAVPTLSIVDNVGSSESGNLGRGRGGDGFAPNGRTAVLSDDLTRRLEPGHDGAGWLAKSGPIPLGYLDDPDRTARTFPVVDGVRYAVPGDRARLTADGRLVLLGRDASVINTGGEKVYAEEVEDAVRTHPDVLDVVVVGVPDERWGQRVVAVVSLRTPVPQGILRDQAAETLARYKLPKEFVVVDEVRRSPAGKADHAWARGVAAGSAP